MTPRCPSCGVNASCGVYGGRPVVCRTCAHQKSLLRWRQRSQKARRIEQSKKPLHDLPAAEIERRFQAEKARIRAQRLVELRGEH